MRKDITHWENSNVMERHDEPVALKIWRGYQICLMVTDKRLILLSKNCVKNQSIRALKNQRLVYSILHVLLSGKIKYVVGSDLQ